MSIRRWRSWSSWRSWRWRDHVHQFCLSSNIWTELGQPRWSQREDAPCSFHRPCHADPSEISCPSSSVFVSNRCGCVCCRRAQTPRLSCAVPVWPAEARTGGSRAAQPACVTDFCGLWAASLTTDNKGSIEQRQRRGALMGNLHAFVERNWSWVEGNRCN